ncbi:serine/threonine-protein kinase [Calycomorphotria hydatis]|uniref:non-specific serine/threonine protein kinase n=1 Tax=Calycomorphotria hydatis TaxID=2528027 RepID=A0A517T6U2_9PLAN|nr:serine/threonine-protein kinase [Calycomorphotria hydatis]QDT64091.1 Serine/threonine-protein kinase PrkC [Calycomorphotria hydatis]
MNELIHGQGLENTTALVSIFRAWQSLGTAPDTDETQSFLSKVPEQQRAFLRELFSNVRCEPDSSTSGLSHLLSVRWPAAGDSFGDYELIKLIGEGPHSRVYDAIQQNLGPRPVVLKVTYIPSHEAHALARLEHENIMPVYGVSDVDGFQAICMKKLDGQPLATVLQSCKNEPPEMMVGRVLDCGKQLLAALRHAHGSGIIHGDVKPENVFVEQNGVHRLMDFGSSIELYGTSLFAGGTPSYMATEQLRFMESGDPSGIGPHTDCFGLGVLLYYAWTGRLPFGLHHLENVSLSIEQRFQAVLFTMRERLISPGLCSLLERMLSPAAETRPSLDEVAAELNRLNSTPCRVLQYSRLHPLTITATTIALGALSYGIFMLVCSLSMTNADRYEIGCDLFGRGQFAQADNQLEQLLSADAPLEIKANVAWTKLCAGDSFLALSALNPLCNSDPSGRCDAATAAAVFYSNRDSQIAEMRLDEAERKGFQSISHYCNRAFILILRSRFEEASLCLDKAEKMDPSDPQIAWLRLYRELRSPTDEMGLPRLEVLRDARLESPPKEGRFLLWLVLAWANHMKNDRSYESDFERAFQRAYSAGITRQEARDVVLGVESVPYSVRSLIDDENAWKPIIRSQGWEFMDPFDGDLPFPNASYSY